MRGSTACTASSAALDASGSGAAPSRDMRGLPLLTWHRRIRRQARSDLRVAAADEAGLSRPGERARLR